MTPMTTLRISRSSQAAALAVVLIALASGAAVAGSGKGVDDAPFVAGEVWSGQYVCSQGLTQMRLHIVSVEGVQIRAIWEFNHPPSGAAGRFWMNGTYEPTTRSLHLHPQQWIVRPDNYVMCDLVGTVAPDGRVYSGRVTSCSSACTWFRLVRPGAGQ
jgi:hypothetical protein